MQDIFGIIYHDGGDLAEWHVAFYKLPLEWKCNFHYYLKTISKKQKLATA